MAEPAPSPFPGPLSMAEQLAALLAGPGRQIEAGIRRARTSTAELFGFRPEALDAAAATAPFGVIRVGPMGMAGMNPQLDPQTLARSRAWLWLSGAKGAGQGGFDQPIPLGQPTSTLPRFQLPTDLKRFSREVFAPEMPVTRVYQEAVDAPFQGLLAERLAVPGRAPEMRDLIDVLTRFRTSR